MKKMRRMIAIILSLALFISGLPAQSVFAEGETDATTYSVKYDGNGNTSGTLPEDQTGIASGGTHVVKKPSDDFMLFEEESGLTFKFKCWNTEKMVQDKIMRQELL